MRSVKIVDRADTVMPGVTDPGVFSPQPLAADTPPIARGGFPLCSVVMTSFRDTRFLREAVDSVLRQSFTDFELIVVDDGSPDPGPVAALAGLDPRIRIVRLDSNLGTGEAANRGIALARGDIIARLDSDDVAEPDWLGRVIGELLADPQLGLVGSAVTFIDEAGRRLGVQPTPESDFAIRFTLLFHSPFYHSTTVFRHRLFQATGGYRTDQPVSQDHYLWFAMLPLCRARNLAEPLVRYRLNPAGLTSSNNAGFPRMRTEPIRRSLWREIGDTYPLDDYGLAERASAALRGHPSKDRSGDAEARQVIELALQRVQARIHEFLWPREKDDAERFIAALRSRASARHSPLADGLRRARQAYAEGGTRRIVRAAARRLRLRRLSDTLRYRWRRASSSTDPVTAAFHPISPYAGFDPSPFPPDMQGWGSQHPAFRALIAELRPELIVEVGSWKGASAIHMASLCREFGLDARIICVDTWLGSTEHVLGLRPGFQESLRPRHGYPQLYYTFLANVLRSGHAPTIVPLPNTSDNAAVILRDTGFRPKLIYIDAAHEEEPVYRDLSNFWPLLAPGGVILGDDFAKYPGVRRAAQRFAEESGARLQDLGDKFVLRSPA